MKNVLVLCTGNSARSILGEVLFSQLPACKGRFKGFSAGSQPVGKVNPLAVLTLQAHGFVTEGLRSKSWDEFSRPGVPVMDYIFTVCDAAAGEACPLWLGQPVTAHWGIPDPAAIGGTDIQRRRAFEEAFAILKRRIERFASLPIETLDHSEAQRLATEIGKS